MKQTNLWAFQDDITKSLNVEQHIQFEFDELNPRKIKNNNNNSGIIKNISIIFQNENKLKITLSHNGQQYICTTPLTKRNIEYMCGITNTKRFQIDKIIGSKINITKMNEEIVHVKKYYPYFPYGIPLSIIYFPSILLVSSIITQIININITPTIGKYILILTIILSLILPFHNVKNYGTTMFEFKKS